MMQNEQQGYSLVTMIHGVGRICGAVNGKGGLMQGLVSSLRPKGAATADVQNQPCLPFYHSDLEIVRLATGKSWSGVSGIKGTSLFTGFWKVKKWMRVIKDRAKYSSGEAAGITSRLMLADTFGKTVSYRKKSSKRSSAKFCLVSGWEKSFDVCGLHFQTIYIALSSRMSTCNTKFPGFSSAQAKVQADRWQLISYQMVSLKPSVTSEKAGCGKEPGLAWVILPMS